MAQTADGYWIRPRLQMSTQIKLIYQKNGRVFDHYYTRIGRVIMHAKLEENKYKTIEDKLSAALTKLGIKYDCEIFAKAIGEA